MDGIQDQHGSWMNMMSKENFVLRMVLMTKLFLWTFWEKIWMSFKIILEYHSQLSKLRIFCFHEVLVVSCCTIHNWSSASRRDTDWSLPGDCLGSSHTWRSVSMVPLSLSPVLEGLSSYLPCSIKQTVDGVQICGDHCTWGIFLLEFCMRKSHVPISSNSCIGAHWGSCSPLWWW